ncbi:MAG: hypothetical protein K2Q01_09515 [Rickettsiales bacterium]|nr:hypothetical protein [Rickettsiales bacterium]
MAEPLNTTTYTRRQLLLGGAGVALCASLPLSWILRPKGHSACIFAPTGLTLDDDQKSFLRDVNPYAYVLTHRHCNSRENIRRIVGELQSMTGRADLPICLDQEGGKAVRLKPPDWPEFPSAPTFSALAKVDIKKAEEAAYLNARLMAFHLRELGITTNLAPVCDVPAAGAHDVIARRAFSMNAAHVSLLAGAFARGMLAGGITPVLKHLPGQGRAIANSHAELPSITTTLAELSETDFKPFANLHDMPAGLVSHCRYTALDSVYPASRSLAVIRHIREKLKFRGLLISDDLAMKALSGPLSLRAANALEAGCDMVLLISSYPHWKAEAAEGITRLNGESLQRAACLLPRPGPKDVDYKEIQARRDALMRTT